MQADCARRRFYYVVISRKHVISFNEHHKSVFMFRPRSNRLIRNQWRRWTLNDDSLNDFVRLLTNSRFTMPADIGKVERRRIINDIINCKFIFITSSYAFISPFQPRTENIHKCYFNIFFLSVAKKVVDIKDNSPWMFFHPFLHTSCISWEMIQRIPWEGFAKMLLTKPDSTLTTPDGETLFTIVETTRHLID